MKTKLLVILALCTLLSAGVFLTGCSQSSEPQKAAAPASAPAPAKEEAKQEAAPAEKAEAGEEEDEDKFGC